MKNSDRNGLLTRDKTRLANLPNIQNSLNGETFNTMYGKHGIKEGHWIVFQMIRPGVKLISNKKENTVNTIIRAKIEEGYYRRNKKKAFENSIIMTAH